MDATQKIEYLARILEQGVDMGVTFSKGQVHILVEVFELTPQQLDLVAEEMQAWRTKKLEQRWDNNGQRTV